MKFNWFNKKENKVLPDYFLEYEDSFLNAPKLAINETRFVVFDTETTGFNRMRDRVLSIGAVSLIDNTLNVNDSFEVYLKQEIFNPETVHIHGILKEGSITKISELEALKSFLKYIGNSILVGHHINFDIMMMNQILVRNQLPEIKNKTLDTEHLYRTSKHTVYQNTLPKERYTLDQLCDELNVSKSDRHTASGDALITAILFLKIIARLDKNNDLTVKDLLNS
ncbi:MULTISPECIES: PolC-type DNA polymerase III [unclassified Polaribacter]|uniref:3'-5' exonuclease n=1 Tax=unclassified Polaribacter TaxID=196858 RepID=UPI001C4F6C7C|nr:MULTISPECIES: 3'-5' exonuclease [unclassified Polaribacter]QXP64758.1 3'-5' exonuclease [Polaribacter sp. HaHaR_3_91]QXP67256.1 3'-5' exonuclease [Polaribacter sp. AHE13PA]